MAGTYKWLANTGKIASSDKSIEVILAGVLGAECPQECHQACRSAIKAIGEFLDCARFAGYGAVLDRYLFIPTVIQGGLARC